MPEVLLAHRVEGPVAGLGVDEDDPRVRIAGVVVAPDVVVAVRTVRVPPGLLEPLVRVGGVVHHQVGDDPDAPLVRGVEQRHEILDGAELRQHLAVVGDVVPAVAQRRVVERRQPEAVDAQPGQVVELVDQAAQVAGAVAVGVGERPDQHLVEDRALVPLAVVLAAGDRPRLAVVAGLRLMDDAVIVGIGHAHPSVSVWSHVAVRSCACRVQVCSPRAGCARHASADPVRLRSAVPTGRSRRTVRRPPLPRSFQSSPRAGIYRSVSPHCWDCESSAHHDDDGVARRFGSRRE